MELIKNVWINKSRSYDGQYKANIFDGKFRDMKDEFENGIAEDLYKTFKNNKLSTLEKIDHLTVIANNFGLTYVNKKLSSLTTTVSTGTTTSTATVEENKIDMELLESNIQNLMNFFTEFDFEPNFRFLNTFTYACNKSKTAAKTYIKNYFELIDSPMLNQIEEKMKSDEFGMILDRFSQVTPNHKVNSRLKIYYGSQGTGKTTEALKEASNCMVCHSAMLPSDLMEDFKFEDGKATFKASALQRAMVNGEIIVLDEINLLPFESLRFLQSILDGKKEFEYKGNTIKIHDNFKVIGTMNLTVNGSTYCLPEPLVDRCEDIKKFNLTAKNLLGAIC